MAALRCSGPCFIEMDAVDSVDVAVTAFHLIFFVSHQGAHSSRLSWSDVSNIHSSMSTHGRRCAIIEFFTHEPKSLVDVAASKPASPSQKLTKVAQMIYEETIAKAADATSRVLKQMFAQSSVVHRISEEPLVAKPTMLYIEDVRSPMMMNAASSSPHNERSCISSSTSRRDRRCCPPNHSHATTPSC